MGGGEFIFIINNTIIIFLSVVKVTWCFSSSGCKKLCSLRTLRGFICQQKLERLSQNFLCKNGLRKYVQCAK